MKSSTPFQASLFLYSGFVFLVVFMAVGQRCYCNCGFLWIREEEKRAAPNLLQNQRTDDTKRKKKNRKEFEGNIRAAVQKGNGR